MKAPTDFSSGSNLAVHRPPREGLQSAPFVTGLAKVGNPHPLRSLACVYRDGGPCPIPVIERRSGGRTEQPLVKRSVVPLR